MTVREFFSSASCYARRTAKLGLSRRFRLAFGTCASPLERASRTTPEFRMTSKSNISSWIVATISITFTLIGLVMLPSDRDNGIVVAAFFGACTTVSAGWIARRRRESNMEVGEVSMLGKVTLRPSRFRGAALGAGLLALGIVLLAFGQRMPPLVQGTSWLITGSGCLLLAGVASGRLPNQYLEFRPNGFLLGSRGRQVLLPWDEISEVRGGEFSHNPALFLWLRNLGRCEVTPPDNLPAFLAGVQRSRSWYGADIMLLTTHYPIDLPVLAAAIERYRNDPNARRELAADIVRAPPQ